MSNDSEREDRENTEESEHPNSPAEAAGLVDFDIQTLLSRLLDARAEVYEGDPRPFELQFTFRTIEQRRFNDVEADTQRQGYVKYRCDLTGVEVSVPEYAPVPAFLVIQEGGEALEKVLRFHPDLLEDRGRLLGLLVGTIEHQLLDDLFGVVQAAELLDWLSDVERIPGMAAASDASYPRREGYEADPLVADDDE